MIGTLLAVCVALATSGQAATSVPAPQHGSEATLTSIVVVDIDRDGDADIVATDAALHLFVWINDGTGHLTQQRPAPANDRSPAAQGPDVERGATASDPSAPTDPPVFDAHAATLASIAFVWSPLMRLGTRAWRDRAPATDRLRGPPTVSPLL
jgi:hypothetical protein